MKRCWVHLVMMLAFAFWATGAAYYVHEVTEHHDDVGQHDDCDGCQTLAAMAVEHTPAVAAPVPADDSVPAWVMPGWHAPRVRAEFSLPTTGPPAILP